MLPTSKKELDKLGYANVDIILFSGDAYVDHPSFGPAVIGRVLEAQGYRVALVPQPNWRDDLRDFKKLGKPRLFFGVTAGNMDSMVNHYTAAKRLRSNDAYTAEGRPGMRPDYAVTVYTQILKKLYPDVPVIIGGIEASLRRLTHYDYWSDSLMPSVLVNSGADYLVYGMGERPIIQLARMLRNKATSAELREIPQIAYLAASKNDISNLSGPVLYLPSHAACQRSRKLFAEHFQIIEKQANTSNSPVLAEPVDTEDGPAVVVNPPFPVMNTEEIDRVYELPFTYRAHPRYKGKAIPALEMIRFSVCLHRGCFGGCSFCTIAAHQGKQIASRSRESVLREVEHLMKMDEYKGHITDLGGPTANMYRMQGINQKICDACSRTSCIYPSICRNLDVSHTPLLALYQAVRTLPGVKKVTIGSGIRYDLFLDGKGYRDDEGKRYFKELLKYHVSGRLKVAPEHTRDNVLQFMHKPSFELYKILAEVFRQEIRQTGDKLQLIPYFISSHPGCTQRDMDLLGLEFRKEKIRVEQVQDFTPTPMTKSSVMFYTGLVPDDGIKVFVERDPQKKALQKESFFRR
ncbi:MAG: YgiQ family radical SAM protein [Clostridia bacterium]|nr:YgiQ family radical SAM protein [Clostridia bacterium]